MMNKILLTLGVFICLIANCYATTDRFGGQRNEVLRSSYSESSPVLNIVIASATENLTGTVASGGMKVKRVIFSGVEASTLTFYDANIFTANTSTKTKLSYVPTFGPSPSQTIQEVNTDMFFSSGIMVNKQGNGIMTIEWDYTTIPTWGGVTYK